ncbi:hypothetical protein CLU79DRAFT_96910 [Phycomyces nitens]|nr:hypothetical protein CLU79DRAFT_96910 [Phycomyces nitens]
MIECILPVFVSFSLIWAFLWYFLNTMCGPFFSTSIHVKNNGKFSSISRKIEDYVKTTLCHHYCLTWPLSRFWSQFYPPRIYLVSISRVLFSSLHIHAVHSMSGVLCPCIIPWTFLSCPSCQHPRMEDYVDSSSIGIEREGSTEPPSFGYFFFPKSSSMSALQVVFVVITAHAILRHWSFVIDESLFLAGVIATKTLGVVSQHNAMFPPTIIS